MLLDFARARRDSMLALLTLDETEDIPLAIRKHESVCTGRVLLQVQMNVKARPDKRARKNRRSVIS